jgi:hypothetical protein
MVSIMYGYNKEQRLPLLEDYLHDDVTALKTGLNLSD